MDEIHPEDAEGSGFSEAVIVDTSLQSHGDPGQGLQRGKPGWWILLLQLEIVCSDCWRTHFSTSLKSLVQIGRVRRIVELQLQGERCGFHPLWDSGPDLYLCKVSKGSKVA